MPISEADARREGDAVPQQTFSTPDIYGGKKPAEVPTYFIDEAAHYLRLPATTIRSWVVGRDYQTGRGAARSKPLVSPADPRTPLLSFLNLVELHILSSIRRGHQVKPKPVRRAIDYLKKTFHAKHPLLDRRMLTDGKSIFIEQYGQYVNISQDGQHQMKVVLDAYLSRIEWDEHAIPIRLFPFTRQKLEDAPELVAIDPRIRSGKPCIAGTAVPTLIVAERHQAGDSVELLVKDYGRSSEEIQEALRYESRKAS
jgi:uncharacterized protein (DUF433 family)